MLPNPSRGPRSESLPQDAPLHTTGVRVAAPRLPSERCLADRRRQAVSPGPRSEKLRCPPSGPWAPPWGVYWPLGQGAPRGSKGRANGATNARGAGSFPAFEVSGRAPTQNESPASRTAAIEYLHRVENRRDRLGLIDNHNVWLAGGSSASHSLRNAPGSARSRDRSSGSARLYLADALGMRRSSNVVFPVCRAPNRMCTRGFRRSRASRSSSQRRYIPYFIFLAPFLNRAFLGSHGPGNLRVDKPRTGKRALRVVRW